MVTLDEITNEKQRVREALARVDAQRERLAGQLAELEATARVLARYNKGSGVRRTASARTAERGKKSSFSSASRRATAHCDHEISWPQG